ncbi:hypothetical protein [Hyalangium versicolor]|uniref:hypothetical protein n=1 Tax=Hyalangium versicolor TaxID=2861190 RepID=UPI001CCE98EB|nr:hypothetical protein [Hyalangium versicolor]
MWDNVRSGATHFQQRKLPPPGHPVRQFFHGLALPFHLHRALWADPAARRRYLRVGIFQSLVILALAFSCHRTIDKTADVAKEHGVQVEREEQDIHIELPFDDENGEDEDTDTPRARSGSSGKTAHVVTVKTRPNDDEARATSKGFLARSLEFWAALFAVIQVAQWFVIALSRDYHDAISRDASLLTGLEPEDPPMTPRVRLDLKWVRNKFSRRIRAFTVFIVGVPVLYVLSLPLPFRHQIASVLISAWSAYWLVVFTTAKSAHAWTNSEAGPPWFLRGWKWLTTRVPGFRWGLLQGWGRFWERRTRSVFPPAAEMEKQPWAFAGLTVTRTLSMVPLVKCFLRPLIPVAAAHLLVSRRIADGASVAEASALPVPPRSSEAPLKD